ncbi:MAG: VCBS repeat-containing protein [Myxococcota bacterium]|nr:VCBS repeat-containing protein [Myxococcota bacterium]
MRATWVLPVLMLWLWGCGDSSSQRPPFDGLDQSEQEQLDEAEELDQPSDPVDEIDEQELDLDESSELELDEDEQLDQELPDDSLELPDDEEEETGPTLGQVGDPCSSEQTCDEGLTCAAGVCSTTSGACSGDSDCSGDSYCCSEGCEPAGVCIPYGSGPRGDVNDECSFEISIGLFEASAQCEWNGPPEGDPYPEHVQILTTPMVADLPNNSGVAAEIIIVSYNCLDGGAGSSVGSVPSCYGVIRILNGQTCEQHESIDDANHRIIASSPPAIADLDNDGFLDIVTQRAVSGLIAYRWSVANGRFETFWVSTESNISGANRYDGPAVHDLNDDGYPEVISASEVYDGRTGARLNPGQVLSGTGAMNLSVVADLDADGRIEIIAAGVWEWDSAQNLWVLEHAGSPGWTHYGYADFGTPGASPAEFDAHTLDGVAELVLSGNNELRLYTLSGQMLMQATGITGGGPPTVGDFDNDGFPEIATAGGYAYRVYDLDCAAAGEGCAAPYLRWAQASQDLSSRTTGSCIFDFEADGRAEAVYADECFTRIYDGLSGEVLFSAFRTSCTWYENAIIADPDKDSNTEIIVGSNANCSISCPAVDPIHRGLRCTAPEECPSGLCDQGFCRCSTDAECDANTICAAPLAGTPGEGNTCRAHHPPGVGMTGIRVLRDRLDRWASSRPMWNQHVYTVTNIMDSGLVPRSSFWAQNFRTTGLNNFRQNVQGSTGADEVPDITGRFDADKVCNYVGLEVLLYGHVCNRGLRAVGAAMPATFYRGDPANGEILCTSYTAGPVPVGDCMEVSCEIDEAVTGEVTMVVNDDGQGGRTTVECNEDNNMDFITVQECVVN